MTFHLAERAPVAAAIEAAAACDTLEQLYDAILRFDAHGVDLVGDWSPTPGWPTAIENPLMICSEKAEPLDAAEGRPYTGAYGDVMRDAMDRFGVRDEDVHVAYCVHWFSSREKSPNATQIATSRPFAFREIELVKPRGILAQGRAVLDCLTGIRDPITPLLNQTIAWSHGDTRTELYVAYHPAFAEKFKINITDFEAQMEGFLERFGRPDGTAQRGDVPDYIQRMLRAA